MEENVVILRENKDSEEAGSEELGSESIDSEKREVPEEYISSESVKEIEESNEVENMKKIEAALFLSARFLNLQELVMLTDVNPLMLKESMEKLKEKYNKENFAIEIVSKSDMWKMDVRQEYVGMINKLATGDAEFTKAEQETLAVIAYKQPVKQSVIIKIRGNKAYDHIKKFRDIGLVKAKKVGHTNELSLSEEFFEYFHIVNKNDLGAQKVLEGAEEIVGGEDDEDSERREDKGDDEQSNESSEVKEENGEEGLEEPKMGASSGMNEDSESIDSEKREAPENQRD